MQKLLGKYEIISKFEDKGKVGDVCRAKTSKAEFEILRCKIEFNMAESSFEGLGDISGGIPIKLMPSRCFPIRIC